MNMYLHRYINQSNVSFDVSCSFIVLTFVFLLCSLYPLLPANLAALLSLLLDLSLLV